MSFECKAAGKTHKRRLFCSESGRPVILKHQVSHQFYITELYVNTELHESVYDLSVFVENALYGNHFCQTLYWNDKFRNSFN